LPPFRADNQKSEARRGEKDTSGKPSASGGLHVKAYLAAAGWLSFYGVLWAADDAFVLEWKLNPSKSKLRDEMKVESVGGNKYALDFDGSIETIEADGTDQPGNFGITLSVSVLGPGRTIITATWTLSQDGNTHLDSPIF